MQSLNVDVAIVGGGGAGLRAAIAVAEKGPALEVALISKVIPMRSHTVAVLICISRIRLPEATGYAIRMSWNISSPTAAKKWCVWSTGAAPGVDVTTAIPTCATSVA
jgi:flavin-dependent dehydrogenase